MNIRKIFPSFDYSRIPELNDPQYRQVSWCEDTPGNWRRFHKLKYLLLSGLFTQAQAPSERQLKEARKVLQEIRDLPPDRVTQGPESCYDQDQS